MTSDNFRDEIQETIMRDSRQLVLLVVSQPAKGAEIPWAKVRVRPVMIRKRLMLQFAYWDGRQEITKNYQGDEAGLRLRELLAQPFRQFHLRMSDSETHVRLTRKGKALVSHGRQQTDAPAPRRLDHDRDKARALPVAGNEQLYASLGLTNRTGRIRGEQRRKFNQIDQFLLSLGRLISKPELADRQRLSVLDCGCGSAYLTFAAYRYLQGVLGRDVQVQGVDVDPHVIDESIALKERLGWTGLDFAVSTIAEWQPVVAPDIVLSLHACDAATDEALAKGVLLDAPLILAAPCCQHELHHALRVDTFRPVLRHGILRERLADILTDGFRAQILRIMGYRTKVVEFISPENTAKNLMIQAERVVAQGDRQMIQEYLQLKAYWGVTPVLETMLGDALSDVLTLRAEDEEGETRL